MVAEAAERTSGGDVQRTRGNGRGETVLSRCLHAQSLSDRFTAGEGFELSRVFVEIKTGKGSDALDRRPQLAAALKEADRQRCPIAVANLSRLSRDVHFISGLMAHRVPFLVPDLDPFILRLFAALAQKGRALISRHTTEALSAAKARGVTLSNPNIEQFRKKAVAEIQRRPRGNIRVFST
jgi:DNA invertase Pin-like site-specific DNA recombinase